MIECVWFDKAPAGPWKPGWCFPAPFTYDLSKRYEELHRAIRPPIMVCLPVRGSKLEGGTQFLIDAHPSDKPDGHWNVEAAWPFIAGTKPDITVTPSINAVGIYHGYLTHGVLTDDLEA